MIRLGHIELFVHDPLATLPFYRDVLGASVTVIQDNQFVWLKIDDLEILLRPGKPPDQSKSYQSSRCAFVIYSDDLADSLAHFERMGVTVVPMKDSAECHTFTDPDGNWFQLVDPSDH